MSLIFGVFPSFVAELEGNAARQVRLSHEYEVFELTCDCMWVKWPLPFQPDVLRRLELRFKSPVLNKKSMNSVKSNAGGHVELGLLILMSPVYATPKQSPIPITTRLVVLDCSKFPESFVASDLRIVRRISSCKSTLHTKPLILFP